MSIYQSVVHDDVSSGRLVHRCVDEFVGYCRCLAAKGQLAAADGSELRTWLSNQRHLAEVPFLTAVADAAFELSDEPNSPELLRELHSLIRQFVGGADSSSQRPSYLPLDYPTPPISFAGRRFCFTGTFDFGTRETCRRETVKRGGNVVDGVTRETNYVVIGANATETWKHSAFGNKIMKADRLRSDGFAVAIISEQAWLAALTLNGDVRPSTAKEASTARGSPNPPQPLDTDTTDEFVMATGGARAIAQVTSDGFIVRAGSTARKRETGSLSASCRELRRNLRAEGRLQESGSAELLQFTRDAVFTSPSAAASVVSARSASGPLEWKHSKSGLCYRDWSAQD